MSEEPSGASMARYIMVGGFLGAGKTTAVLRLAQWFQAQGKRVGLITNDQGSRLVDTTMLSAHGFAVEEIAGGCFCCRFNSLVEAAHNLSAQDLPDVFIAEPVGSCTDLVATVSYPLRRIYGSEFTIAPLSVLVDPIRALRMLGLAEGGSFSEKVRYIFLKQLEEADLIVVNKRDLLEAPRRARLVETLKARFPTAEVLEISARDNSGLAPWIGRIDTATPGRRASMEVDYDVYAEGEALLGWLNATVKLTAVEGFDGNRFLQELAGLLQGGLKGRGAEVAHLKMTLEPEGGLGELAIINLVRNDYVPELAQEIEEPVECGLVIVNVRAEASPDVLRTELERALASLAGPFPIVETRLDHLEFFQPGRPQPTHRMEVADP